MKRALSFFCLLCSASCYSSVNTKSFDIKNLDNKYIEIDVNSLVTKSTLECKFNTSSKPLIDFYGTLSESQIKTLDKNKFMIGSSYIVNDVKSISSTHKKDSKEDTVNMDVNFNKFGVDILRVSSFLQDGEYEGFGYYFILKGNPLTNLKLLKKHNIDTEYSVIEQTKGGNTRVRCTLVG